jgi:hypothetical protein
MSHWDMDKMDKYDQLAFYMVNHALGKTHLHHLRNRPSPPYLLSALPLPRNPLACKNRHAYPRLLPPPILFRETTTHHHPIVGGPCEGGDGCSGTHETDEDGDEFCSEDESRLYGGTFAARHLAWISYCHFAALLTTHGISNCRVVLDKSMRGVFEGKTLFQPYRGSAIMAFEKVLEVSGDIFWDNGGTWYEEHGYPKGDEQVKKWLEHEETMKGVAESAE